MTYDPSDATTAKQLLTDAIAPASEPVLSTDQVDRAFSLAASLDADSNVVYLPRDLDRAAAWAWGIKAGLASDAYDIGGGSGVYLKLSDEADRCNQMQAAFRRHEMSVTGIGMISGLNARMQVVRVRGDGRWWE